ncbi:MAG: ABC transporter substrate-binding protein [bacterium]
MIQSKSQFPAGLKFLLVPLTLLCITCFLAGCKGSAAERGDVGIAIAASPITLDPRLATDAEGDKIASLICEGLLARDEDGDLIPLIAERFERVSDTSYRFYLREGVRFSDGTPLTAEDVVFTFHSIMDGSIASPFRGAFERVAAVDAESPQIVRFDLKGPFAPFLSYLTRGIVSKKVAEAAGTAFGSRPICVGPYKLVRFVPDSVVELAANDAYYGEAPKNARLIFDVIKDDNVRAMKLMKGDVDLVQNAIPALMQGGLLKGGAIEMEDGDGTVMAYLGMNLTDPILSNPKVRKAIAYAIDRDEIISHRFKGMASKANSILSPRNWAYDRELAQYEYDPQKAKALLDEAGFKDPDGDGPLPRFRLKYKTSTVKERVEIARMIAHQLEKVGIDARVVPYEWGTFYRDIRKGNFQIYTLSWVGVAEPDIFYEVCNSSQVPPNGMNRDHYSNEEVDRLVEQGRTTLDEEKRKEIYARVQRILFDDLPYIPLWYEKNVTLYRRGVEGVSVRPDASYRVFVDVSKK